MKIQSNNILWRSIRPRDLMDAAEIFEDWEHDPNGAITINDVQRYISASQHGTQLFKSHEYDHAKIDLAHGGKFWHTLVAVDESDVPQAVWVMRIEEGKIFVENIILGQAWKGLGLFKEICATMSAYLFVTLRFKVAYFEVAASAGAVFHLSNTLGWKRVDDPEVDRLALFESTLENRNRRLAQEGNMEHELVHQVDQS